MGRPRKHDPDIPPEHIRAMNRAAQVAAGHRFVQVLLSPEDQRHLATLRAAGAATDSAAIRDALAIAAGRAKGG